MSNIAPLVIENALHGNPERPPQFSVEIKNSHGETVPLACPRATRAMVALMDMEAVIGGAASHYGGPAAFAEMVSAVHGYMFFQSQKKSTPWHQMYHWVNDAGHCENGIYALKANYGLAGLNLESLKQFRSIKSPLTGHGEAHLFPQGVYVSNGPLGSGLPQAQGLAAAESMASNPRITITAISDGACMEGEAKEALAGIPGLAAKGKLGPFICLVSDNNTKLSGRIDEDSFSMAPTFESLASLGWKVTKVEDGHNIQDIYRAFEKSMDGVTQDPKTPHLLWVKTIKGKGVAATEQSKSGGHGFPIKKSEEVAQFVQEIYSGAAMPAAIADWTEQLNSFKKAPGLTPKFSGSRVKVQEGVSQALIEEFEGGAPIVSISADLQGSTGVAGFRKKFPEACFEVGVAESNMVSMAIGLSKQGYIPIVDTFAQFGVTKGALPLIMSGLSQGPFIGIYSHTGFQDAADGASHQSLTYLAMTMGVPNVDVYVLSCKKEAHQLVGQAVQNFVAARKSGELPRTQIFFLGREVYLDEYEGTREYQLGEAQVIKEDLENQPAITLVSVGPMIENTLLAQKTLKEDFGIGSIVVNASAMSQPDLETLKKCLAKTNGYCLTVEDHRLVGGFGSRLAHGLTQDRVSFRMQTLGIGDQFGRSAYQAQDLYNQNGLGVMDIVKVAKDFLRG